MQPRLRLKIEGITPSSSDFDLYFEIDEILARDADKIACRLVDDTGIIDAAFNRFSNKLERGGCYAMTNLNAVIVDSRIRVQMSSSTIITKEPNTIGFKDKCNDRSKLKFGTSSNKLTQSKQNQKVSVLPESSKTHERLIPFSKQQAAEQLKQKLQFQKQLYNKSETVKDGKMNQQATQKYGYKQKNNNRNKNEEQESKIKYMEKNQARQHKQKKSYKEKDWEQKVQKSISNLNNRDNRRESSGVVWKQKGQFLNKRGKVSRLCDVVTRVGQEVNVVVWVTDKRRKTRGGYTERLVADFSGSVWLQLNQVNLESKQSYQIDNVLVCEDGHTIYLREIKATEAQRIQKNISYNLRDINQRQ